MARDDLSQNAGNRYGGIANQLAVEEERVQWKRCATYQRQRRPGESMHKVGGFDYIQEKLREGLTLDAISKMSGCSVENLKNVLRAAGLKVPE